MSLVRVCVCFRQLSDAAVARHDAQPADADVALDAGHERQLRAARRQESRLQRGGSHVGVTDAGATAAAAVERAR